MLRSPLEGFPIQTPAMMPQIKPARKRRLKRRKIRLIGILAILGSEDSQVLTLSLVSIRNGRIGRQYTI